MLTNHETATTALTDMEARAVEHHTQLGCSRSPAQLYNEIKETFLWVSAKSFLCALTSRQLETIRIVPLEILRRVIEFFSSFLQRHDMKMATLNLWISF